MQDTYLRIFLVSGPARPWFHHSISSLESMILHNLSTYSLKSVTRQTKLTTWSHRCCVHYCPIPAPGSGTPCRPEACTTPCFYGCFFCVTPSLLVSAEDRVSHQVENIAVFLPRVWWPPTEIITSFGGECTLAVQTATRTHCHTTHCLPTLLTVFLLTQTHQRLLLNQYRIYSCSCPGLCRRVRTASPQGSKFFPLKCLECLPHH